MYNFMLDRLIAVRRTTGVLSSTLLPNFPDLAACMDESQPSYYDKDTTGPIMATWKEAEIAQAFVRHIKPAQVLEIGCSVGWTTAHIARGLPKGSFLTCVDPFLETANGLAEYPNGDTRSRFLENMDRCAITDSLVRLVVAESPAILPTLALDTPWDLVFVDGWAHKGQPLQHIQGLIPLMGEKTVVVMRNFLAPDVQAAGQHLCQVLWEDTDVQRWYFVGYLTRFHMGIFLPGVYQAKGAHKYPKYFQALQDDISRILVVE